MNRQLLVIHPSGMMRKLITRYVMAELEEWQLEVVESAAEGLTALGRKTYDLVISALEMPGIDGLELNGRMGQIKLNRNTPLVVVTNSGTTEQQAELKSQGIQHYLIAPFTAAQLTEMVENAQDWRTKRSQARYCIPNSGVVILAKEFKLKGSIINVSLGGLLAEFVIPVEMAPTLSPVEMATLFPETYHPGPVAGIRASLVRLHVIAWNEDNRPSRIRTAWRFVHLTVEAEEALQEVLDKAEEELSQAARAANRELTDT